MSDLSQQARNSVALQAEMFRRAAAEEGLSIKVLLGRTSASETTLRGWARGEHQMPAWALGELGIPDHLTSLVLDPFGKHVGSNEDGEGDLGALECEASGVVHEIAKAKRDGKVTPPERARIAAATRRMIPAARAVAA